MNKGELISRVADECGMSKEVTGMVINVLLTVISQTLAADEKVKLVGFGTFSLAERPARRMRMPRSGNLVQIPARKAIHFKPGATFKETIRAVQ